MDDAKLIFDDGSTAITTSKISTVLDFASIEEPGAGTPVFLEIWLDTAFTTSTETLKIDLVSKASTDPTSSDVIMTVMPATAASGLGTPGLLVRCALPSVGLERYTALSYVESAALAAGKIKAKLVIQ